jgi:hypothetical protein
MKIATALVWLSFASVAAAQDVTTSFTLGTPTTNCIPVLTQDGVSTGGQGAVCPSGFSGGATMQISLPRDPINPGNPLNMYSCTAAVVSNTVPVFSTTTPGAPGSLVQSVSCGVEYSYFSATWTGTLTYDYDSVKQTHCVGGRGAHCVTGYYPVWASGSGTLSTAQPPPPPPPPPQPTVSVLTLTLEAAPCDPQTVCELVPTDPNAVASGSIDFSSGSLTLLYADGRVRTAPAGLGVSPNGDDGTSYTITFDGALYDADGNSNQTVDLQLVTTSNDPGPFTIASGTLAVTTTTPPPLALTLVSSTCDASYVCTLLPSDPRLIASAQFSLFGFQLTLENADGSETAVTLRTLSVVPNDPEGLSYTVSGSGTTFDESVEFTLDLTVGVDELLSVASGSLNLQPL